MTICAVMKHGSSIHVAIDSRLTFGSTPADAAVKIMALPLRLYYAGSSAEPVPQLAHSRVLGLATVGSAVTTLIAKELIESIFASLQFDPGLTDLSFTGIAELCANVLRAVSRDICAVLFDKGRGELVLVGNCLETAMSRAFALTIDVTPTAVDVKVTELLTAGPAAFFGSGATTASALHREHPDWPSYRIVRALCDDATISSVGGNIQFGVLQGDDFRVLGIHDYRLNHQLKEIYTGFFLAGIELYGGTSLFGDTGFAIRQGFLSPFAQEIADYMTRGYAGTSKTEHW